MRLFLELLRDESGQDFVEYTLLVAFLAVAALAVFSMNHDACATIWGRSGDSLDQADSVS